MVLLIEACAGAAWCGFSNAQKQKRLLRAGAGGRSPRKGV